MKIVSLNIWGGRAGKENLLDFFRTHSASVDVFCLQEVWAAPYLHLEGQAAGGVELNNDRIMVYGLREISEALPNHTAYFRPHHGDNYGLLMMVRNTLTVVEEGEVYVYKHKGYEPEGDVGNHARNIQYVTIQTPTGPQTVINFHGLWTNEEPGKGKKDSPERLIQSEKIVTFVKALNNPFVLCGDFNLLPDTQSIRVLEENGLRNLIREFDITSTRTSFYTKPGKFADYAFISKDLELKEFKILPDEVSDHAPMLIEVE